MAQLKQSATYNRVILLVGSADHITGLAGATLTITASKAGGAFATITPTVTDRGSGFYNLALTTAHTDTLGDLAFHITATSADPTDIIDQVIAQDLNLAAVPANVTQFGGVAGTFASGRPEVNTTHFGGTIAPTPNTPGIPMVDGRQTVFSGALAAATATTVTLPAGASTVDNFYNDCMVIITGGTGNDQARAITGYVGSTKVATVDRAFVTTPAASDTFIIYAFVRVNVNAVAGTGQTARDLGAQLDATISSRQATLSLPVSANVTQWNGTAVATPNTAGVPLVDDRASALRAGTLQAATGSTATLDTGASATDNFYNGQVVVAGGQSRRIISYVGATKVATLASAWTTAPGATAFFIYANPPTVDVGHVSGTVQTARDLGAQLDAAVSSRLAPTTAGRTLDVSATGEAGIDWANIGTPATTVNLSGTTVNTVTNAPAATVDTAAVATAVWDKATTGITAVGSIGLQLKTNLDATVTSRMATFTLPANFSALAVTAGGAVTAGTVSDKTGYSLSQAFPANFSALGITAAGRVDVGSVSGTVQTARDLGANIDVAVSSRMATFTLPTNFSSMSISAAGRMSSDVTFWNGSAVATPNSAGVPVVDDRSNALRIGTAQAVAAGTITLDAGASATDSYYNDCYIVTLSGTTGAGQVRLITGYTGATKIATVSPNWTTTPTGTIVFAVLAQSRVDIAAVSGTVQTARDLGAQLDAAISSRMATFTLPANFSALAVTAGGAITAGTVSDKTGYALTQAFPTNFSSLAITAGGAVTAGTVSDKTGYSLTQAFPTNFSSLSVDVNGRVDVSKVLGTAQTARDLGGQLDATISSRLASAGYTAPDNTSITAIKTKTDFLPSATAGAAGGVLIAGTNSTATFTSGITANITGNLSGSVGSVTGAVGSVTGNVGGNVTGSVGSISDPTSIFSFVVENSKTFVQLIRGMTAALMGKAAGVGTASVTFRDNADTKNRISATVSASGDRTAITTDLT